MALVELHVLTILAMPVHVVVVIIAADLIVLKEVTKCLLVVVVDVPVAPEDVLAVPPVALEHVLLVHVKVGVVHHVPVVPEDVVLVLVAVLAALALKGAEFPVAELVGLDVKTKIVVPNVRLLIICIGLVLIALEHVLERVMTHALHPVVKERVVVHV